MGNPSAYWTDHINQPAVLTFHPMATEMIPLHTGNGLHRREPNFHWFPWWFFEKIFRLISTIYLQVNMSGLLNTLIWCDSLLIWWVSLLRSLVVFAGTDGTPIRWSEWFPMTYSPSDPRGPRHFFQKTSPQKIHLSSQDTFQLLNATPHFKLLFELISRKNICATTLIIKFSHQHVFLHIFPTQHFLFHCPWWFRNPKTTTRDVYIYITRSKQWDFSYQPQLDFFHQPPCFPVACKIQFLTLGFGMPGLGCQGPTAGKGMLVNPPWT